MSNFGKLSYIITRLYFAFLIILTAVVLYSSAIIPDYIHICKAKDPNIGPCINNSVNHLRSRLKTGIPDLDVPPMEPLMVDEIRLQRGPAGAAINCNITNLKVWGPASFVITDIRPEVSKNKFNFKLWLPHLYFQGDYELDMRILLINVRGKGAVEGNFTDYRSDVIMKGKKITKDNQEYLKFDKIRIRLHIGKQKLKFENLFNNDPILRQISNDIVNENSDLFINEIKPALENSLAEKFTEIANKITLKFTYNELFP
ncbi:hypothetical protein ILUMI_21677 [Ignelater luminosus]|uniref:Protein takeout n=1 Tax=Ignelater luminosus TaxID=2038154 RepID=A0A8K0G3M8_IGNLU|nr:hypothetical protein ILUMI_21677 [Ignelater luminosus]